MYSPLQTRWVSIFRRGLRVRMAIPIPNLPTDNLYKFQALSGLFIGVFCIVFLHLQVSETTKSIAIAEAEIANSDLLISILEGENSPLIDNEMRSQLYTSLLEKQANLRISNAKNREETKLSRYLLNPLHFISLISLLLSFRGFHLWYHRVQKLHDEILQINLEKAKLETIFQKGDQPTL